MNICIVHGSLIQTDYRKYFCSLTSEIDIDIDDCESSLGFDSSIKKKKIPCLKGIITECLT